MPISPNTPAKLELGGARSRHSGGMGLGLAIAKEFVEAHRERYRQEEWPH